MFRWVQACTLGIAASLGGQAHAVDVDAGDYTALPEGTNLGMLYYQHAERRSLYADGHEQPGKPGLDSDIGILRGVHFMKLGGFTIDPQFLLPFGQLEGQRDTAGLGKSDAGIGDLILASTVWLVERAEAK
ncbi:transporter, partial [Pseudomonas sp. MAFF212427]